MSGCERPTWENGRHKVFRNFGSLGAYHEKRKIAKLLDFDFRMCYNKCAHIIAHIAGKLPQFLLDGVAKAWR